MGKPKQPVTITSIFNSVKKTTKKAVDTVTKVTKPVTKPVEDEAEKVQKVMKPVTDPVKKTIDQGADEAKKAAEELARQKAVQQALKIKEEQQEREQEAAKALADAVVQTANHAAKSAQEFSQDPEGFILNKKKKIEDDTRKAGHDIAQGSEDVYNWLIKVQKDIESKMNEFARRSTTTHFTGDGHGKLEHSQKLTSRPNWMAMFSDKKLHEILIPGTHDSATCQFVDASQTLGRPDLQGSLVEQAGMAGIRNFAQCQYFDIYDQLMGGIRCLDIRVYNEKFNGQLYCAHSFLAVPLVDVLQSVKTFIQDFPSEIIILNVQGDGGDSLLNDAKDKAHEILSGFITPKDPKNSVLEGEVLGQLKTLNIGELAAKGSNIFYLEKGSSKGLEINNSWNTTKSTDPVKAVDNCKSYAQGQTRSNGHLVLLALQATMFEEGDLPTVGGVAQNLLEPQKIVKKLSALGLKVLAEYANYEVLMNFLKDERAVTGSNIINMDFANDLIIETVIHLNRNNRLIESPEKNA